MSTVDGLVLLDKPENITSFSVLGTLKRDVGTKKVGHTGTLDKFASGLLVVLTGNYTRFAEYVTGMSKEYTAVFEFGRQTETLDPEGAVVATGPIPSLGEIEKKLPEFTGNILQKPPEFSAIHLDGKRAHEIARAGGRPEMPERRVTIGSIRILAYEEPFLRVSVACGKGTYIRSLARDLGRALGTCGYVTGLRRTAVGTFHVQDAIRPEDFKPSAHLLKGRALLGGIFPAAALTVRAEFEQRLKSGGTIDEGCFLEKTVSPGLHPVFSEQDSLVALIDLGDGGFSYRFVAA
jgi:tRNA pseudouridine55 synthase